MQVCMPSEMCGDGFEWYLVGDELHEIKIELLAALPGSLNPSFYLVLNISK